MKLRNKVLWVLISTWLILLILTYLGSRKFLLQSFLELERNEVNQNIGRVEQALDLVLQALASFTADWAHWTDAYNYILGKRPDFVTGNLNMAAYANSHINLLLYFNKFGKLIVGTSVDLDHAKHIPYPPSIFKYLHPDSFLIQRKDVNVDDKGYLRLPTGIMLVVASSLTDGNKTLPIEGTLVTGRWLSPAVLTKIHDLTKLEVALYLPEAIKDDLNLNKFYWRAIKNFHSNHLIQVLDKNTIIGCTIIRDFNHKPIGLLKFKMDRAIYKDGLKSINYFLGAFLGLAILITQLLWWLLRILILKRLEMLDKQIYAVNSAAKLSQRVIVKGHDELSSVASKVNAMLAIIQQSHKQLERTVQQRTQELQSTNIKLKKEIVAKEIIEKELRIHKEHLVQLAHYDNLTGLANRAFFNDTSNKALSYAKRHNKILALLLIDIDRFKYINDALGHPIGDNVLREIATRFSSCLRSEDTLARLGGDEFIILINNVNNPSQVTSVAKKLLKVFKKPLLIEQRELFLAASIGISIFPNDGDNLQDLQKNSDMAMYKAKKLGGNTFNFFTKELNRKAHQLIELEASLRNATLKQEFILHYQPKIELANKTIIGVEALIRWQHPQLGIIMPKDFISLAEETGLIISIGEWALRQACKDAKSWQDQGLKPIAVAVNLSPVHLRQTNLLQIINNILNETGLTPHYLELEITESAVMEEIDIVIQKLKNIKKLGVSIALDDFGTGYSSISHLKSLPINTIKIDQTFIKSIPKNKEDRAIIKTIIKLAHDLNLSVTAEGIETVEQLDFLTNNNCDIGQGYLLGKPILAEDLIHLL